MYCAACGTQITAGLSYCNRCGANLKERTRSSQDGRFVALLAAITTIGLGGLGIMLGGALVLTKDALLKPEVVGVFMFMTFVIVVTLEIYLCRMLSQTFRGTDLSSQRLTSEPLQDSVAGGTTERRALHEPLPSVTENTTRTLEYSSKEAR